LVGDVENNIEGLPNRQAFFVSFPLFYDA